MMTYRMRGVDGGGREDIDTDLTLLELLLFQRQTPILNVFVYNKFKEFGLSP